MFSPSANQTYIGYVGRNPLQQDKWSPRLMLRRSFVKFAASRGIKLVGKFDPKKREEQIATIDANGSSRLRSLDGLRGIAAIYVVFFHVLFLPPKISLPYADLSDVIRFGHTGVFLFFVISGFSLSMTMPRHDKFVIPWASYAISRIFRIVPCFLAMIVVSILLVRTDEVFTAARILTNLTFTFNLVPGHQQGIALASWTIGVEMLFYVVFIPLYRMRLWWQVLTAAATLCVFFAIQGCMSPDYAQWTVLGYFPLFVVGMIAFEVYDKLQSSDRSASIGLALIGAGLLTLGACIVATHGQHSISPRTAVGIGYALLLVGCALRRPAVLDAAPLLFFGTISYSLYLVHAPVIVICRKLFVRIVQEFPPMPAYALCASITFAFATTLSYALYFFVEKPGIQAGKTALKLLEKRTTALASP